MNRYHAIQKLMSIVDEKVVIVGNLGPTSDEMRHARHRDKNFYTYGSMGLCSSIAFTMKFLMAVLRDIPIVLHRVLN